MARAKQQEFQGDGLNRPKDIFGGSLLKNGNARSKRPLASKFAIHVVMRANKSVMRKPALYGKVQDALYDTAKKHGVRLYESTNVGNHLHLLLKLPSVRAWAPFIRELSGRIAMACSSEGDFWKWRPFTRIIRSWKRGHQTVKEYLHLNQLEAQGFINRRDTKTLKDLRVIFEPQT